MMSMYDIIVKAHGGFAMLLDIFALLCFFLAAVTLVAGSKGKVLKAAQKLTFGQSILGGLVALTGLFVMFSGPWGYKALWMWAGVILVVVYPILSVRVTKPALASVVAGESAGKWFLMTIVHVVMLLTVHALMVLKNI